METFPRYWPFVRGIHRSPVNSPHKGQWRGALMFYLICVWINGWVNNREAGDLRRYRAHYDVTVMRLSCWGFQISPLLVIHFCNYYLAIFSRQDGIKMYKGHCHNCIYDNYRYVIQTLHLPRHKFKLSQHGISLNLEIARCCVVHVAGTQYTWVEIGQGSEWFNNYELISRCFNRMH